MIMGAAWADHLQWSGQSRSAAGCKHHKATENVKALECKFVPRCDEH